MAAKAKGQYWDTAYAQVQADARTPGRSAAEKAAIAKIIEHRAANGKTVTKAEAARILKTRTAQGKAVGGMKAGRTADGKAIGLKGGFKPKKAPKPHLRGH